MAKGEEVIDDLLYTASHEWARKIGDNKYQIGITDFAQHNLKDIYTVDVPKVGRELKQYEEWGKIESEKGASDLCTPLSGKVLATNEQDNLGEVYDTEEPDPGCVRYVGELSNINQKPYDTWLVELEITNPGELDKLLSPADYKKEIGA